MIRKLYFIPPFILQSTLWWLVMRPLFRFFARLEIRGLKHVTSLKSPVIFAPNHASLLDSVLLPLALPFWGGFSPMFYLTNVYSHFRNKEKFGWLVHILKPITFKLLGAYPTINGNKDYSLALALHTQIIDDGGSVCIFPEGAITKDGLIGLAHGGVGYLAFKTRRSVVPVLISGTYKITLSDIIHRKRKIVIEFCEPVSADVFGVAEDVDIGTLKKFSENILQILRNRQLLSASKDEAERR